MQHPRLTIENILADHILKEDVREVPVKRRVFIILLSVAFIVVGAVFLQFLYLSTVRHGFYADRALQNISDTVVTPAPRGIIQDRYGKPLVQNDHSFNAYLLPRLLPRESEGRLIILTRVAELTHADITELAAHITNRDWQISDRILLQADLSQEELVALSSERLPGVTVEAGFKRVQEEPLVFSHLIGYTGLVNADDLKRDTTLVMDDEIGRAGLEAYYDDVLRGTNGEDTTFKNALGKMQDTRIVHDSKPGRTINTYIDRDLQEFFYNRLNQALKSLGRDVGVGIAMNPQNGEVLAMVGIPGFDANNVSDFLNSKNQALFNRAVGGKYNPGSTIKPLVASAALSEGIISPDKQIYSAGYIDVPNPYNPDAPSRFLDWRPQGWVDLAAALAKSSNVYFYTVGGGFGDQKGLGITLLKKWWEKFNLGGKTNIDLPGETTGFLPDPDWKKKATGQPWRLGDTYNVTIGQGDFSITPIGLIDYISTIANGGTIYKPRIVKSIEDAAHSSSTVSQETQPVVLRDLRNDIQDIISYVHKGMRDAVREPYGTAHLLNSIPMEIAAKTGSAQVENNTKTNAFFVGFAPADNPQIAILVLIENSREGSANTIPVARDVLMWYYQNRLKSR
ncbi:MAG: penicillin-binding protein 2 [Candidatus Jorgensenbacteria bacterium]|nr:penicillin-binding protein 2 [Candidatus Jorgensenbacteria bacterium]